MDEAATGYTKALENRNAVRRRPPHDIIDLQTQVRNYSQRLQDYKTKVKQEIAKRYAPSRIRVTRPAEEGLYMTSDGKLLLRRVSRDGPSTSFWNVDKNASSYLKQDGRSWKVKYGNDAGAQVTLSEYWTASGGVRR